MTTKGAPVGATIVATLHSSLRVAPENAEAAIEALEARWGANDPEADLVQRASDILGKLGFSHGGVDGHGALRGFGVSGRLGRQIEALHCIEAFFEDGGRIQFYDQVGRTWSHVVFHGTLIRSEI